MSTTSLSRAQSAGSFTPGRDSARLKTSIASGFGASHTEWVPTSNPVMSRKVEGPPHIGRREDLLKENKALHKALEAKTVECQHAERILEELGASRENERGKWSAEHVRLANEIGELVSRASVRRAAFSSLLPGLTPFLPSPSSLTPCLAFDADAPRLPPSTQRAEMAKRLDAAAQEKAKLEMELTMVKSELNACSARLAKTHEALGISAEKASMLEQSQGRLQIDLHGTLTTLEEASRRHKVEKASAEEEAKEREAELMEQLSAAREQASKLAQKLEAANAHTIHLKEVLAETKHEADTDRLHLRHQIERLAERIEVAEGRRLDPTVLSNIKFAKSLLIAPPRGRLQQTVPPTFMASPAPIDVYGAP